MEVPRFYKRWYFVAFLIFIQIAIAVSQQQSVPKVYSSYRPLPYCNPSEYFVYPNSTEDVISIVKSAISQGLKVKAIGSRHSQTDLICTEGLPIANQGLKSAEINPDGSATLGAGMTLKESTEFLRANNRAFKTTPAYGDITIAGALGTGSHGSSIKYHSSLSGQVISMNIVDGLGNLRSITDLDDLNAFKIHLGLLGILVNVTFHTVPLYKVRAFNYIASDTVLTSGTVLDWARNADQISIYWFPSQNKVVVANWSIIDVNSMGDATTNDHVPSFHSSFSAAFSSGYEAIQALGDEECPIASATAYKASNLLELYAISTLVQQTPDFVPIYSEDGKNVVNPAVGFYDKMFAPVCNEGGNSDLQCLWAHGEIHANVTILDNEISLALDDLPEFILKVKDILTKAPGVFPLQGILMRFSAASEVYMSTAYRRDTVHFEFYLVNRKNRYEDPALGIAAFQAIMQTATKSFGGRSHWGKSGLIYHSSPMLDLKLDETARSNFKDVMNRYDPNGIFLNNFGRRLKGTSETIDTDPKSTRCGLQDNCYCSQNKDCGSSQRCTTVPGYDDYPVCQTINESPSLLPALHINNSVSSIVTWLNELLPAVISATKLTCLLTSLLG